MHEFIRNLKPRGICATYGDEVIDVHLEAYKRNMIGIKESGADLLEVSTLRCCCPECAKYQGRIYSLSGKDPRFPKFPEWLIKTQCSHCGLMISPFFEGISSSPYVEGDIFVTSNRPFIDDRPKEDKDIYYEIIAEYEEEQEDRRRYDLLVSKCADIAPKSYSAYRRMKKQKSKGYLLLAKEAKNLGVDLPV